MPRWVNNCQLMPYWLALLRVTSAINTSSSTCGGRTSSCSIVSWSTEKLGGAVRITSELVAWSGTIVVRPTRPGPPAWALSATPAAAGDHRGVRARPDLDAGGFARHLLQERDALFRTDVVERDDLRHQTQRGWGGELLPDPHRAGRGALLLRHHLRHGSGLHDDQALAFEDRLEHGTDLRGRHRFGGLERDAPAGDVGEDDVHAEHGRQRADDVAQVRVHIVDADRLRLLQGERQEERECLHGLFRSPDGRRRISGPDGCASVTVESVIATSRAPATRSPTR